MSFDALPERRPRIAIIGGGISGLATAYLLAEQADVTLFEASPRLGGHARTVMAGRNGNQPVDTGFIVFNYVNYPHLTAMFKDLDVPVTRSDMSFGATVDNGAVEYGLRDLPALIGQRRNLLRPAFHRMVRDIFRFNARAEEAASDDSATISDLVGDLKLGRWFNEFYLRPVCGAIWSTPPAEIANFPARALVQFFRNHALLSHSGQHQWWTVKGGSVEYVTRLQAHLAAKGVDLRPGTPVTGVTRDALGASVHAAGREPLQVDQVVMACHSDRALKLLDRPTALEIAALSALRYQDNHMVLHCDPAQMPLRRACWSSWVYKADQAHPQGGIGVTYWMNRLQGIPDNDPLFVSLNPATDVAPETVFDEKTFRHPIFDAAALRAQGQIAALQGQNHTWFAGAYLRHGFHEDGFASAQRVARGLLQQGVLA
ncbi:cyclopropane-fatty-acyl-phospholipid synthase [Actibacterium mucosum KCTC 23349]|uniref:Cyclopropane-fatty-acyl-phospholipid synthase n=1 Tax=Actibacterium mucosum KCTC 23349 TaxID=1454373 RepID=A0A037ZIG3_9RHOB|nr:FAD-dependent oxidoreductase [Actibacterium mucosum]KAJ56240.1 cyclopropane-fatty-acyl-phospholipid synthase [Actibacterium mucosum KCTC 23349]